MTTSQAHPTFAPLLDARLGALAAGHLAGMAALAGLVVLVLVPVNPRVLRRRVLGEA